MKSFLEKFIALVVIISMLWSVGFSVFPFSFHPKTAKALDGGAGFINNIKELVLDAVANVISNMVYKRLEQNIYDWGTGKKSSIRLPFGIEDFKDYFDEFLNIASAKFLDQFRNTQLCTGINVSLGQAPSLALSNVRTIIGSSGRSAGRFSATFGRYYTDRPTYQQLSACTLDKVVNNIESFIKRPRISIFGWDAWKALNQPQNNIFGAFYSALDYKTQLEISETMNAANKAAVSGGYRNQETTTSSSQDKCKEACRLGTGLATCAGQPEMPGSSTLGMPCTTSAVCDAGQDCMAGLCAFTSGAGDSCEQDKVACISNCARIPFAPLAMKVSTLGSSIHKSMDDAVSSDLMRIINVSEITQLAGIFFQALFNKAINGMGLAYSALKATAGQQNRSNTKDNYAYFRQFTKATTAAAKQEQRKNILASLDNSIKELDRSIVACDGDTMMTFQDWEKNIAEILQSNVQGLYVAIEGVNIQPDAITLDPPYAPFSVYGYSWGEIFPSKVPQKCRAILNKLNMASNTTCSDIISGLEPNYNLTQPEIAQCRDTRDNDGDGFIDYPSDPDCYSALDNSEAPTGGGGGPDPCLVNPELPQCREVPYVMDIIPGVGNSPCIPCIYDHDALSCPVGPVPPQPFPTSTGSTFWDTVLGRVDRVTTNTVWTGPIVQQKNDHYKSCVEWYVMALNRCDECLKKYDEKCVNLDTPEERNACILKNCNNYGESTDPATGHTVASITDHVIDPPTDALDFYGKCLIEEQKDACLTCLKEYYMPATYCEQMRDYTARLVDKYPAIVVDKYRKDEGEFRGLYDQAIAARGGLCNDNTNASNMSLALICRGMPDYSYNGEKACQTRCFRAGMTQAQLNDVSDFRPDEADCGNQTLPVGGQDPFSGIDRGVLLARGICCADFHQNSRRNYTTCVGAGPTTEEGGGTVTPLSVTLSAGPASGPAPLNNVDLMARVTGAQTGETLTYNFDCNSDGTFERIVESAQTTVTATDLCSYTDNNTTYTATVTVMTEVGLTATATVNIQTTDCEINYTLDPASGIVPVNINITARLNNSDSGSFTYVFYCDVPTTGADISRSNWQGASIEYVVSDNPYTLDGACNITEARARGIGVWIRSSATDTSCYKVTNTFQTPRISCTVSASGTTLRTTATPDAAFIANIGTASGINFSYDCNEDGSYGDVMHTINGYTDTNAECSSYFTDPTIENYNVGVRVSAIAPSGLSAEGDCQTQVTIPRPPIVQPPIVQ